MSRASIRSSTGIVELTIARVEPGQPQVTRTLDTRVNPETPIPAEATAVHGITDADVGDQPTFRLLAPRVVSLLEGADVIGYNHRNYDLRLLAAECRRAGVASPARAPG